MRNSKLVVSFGGGEEGEERVWSKRNMKGNGYLILIGLSCPSTLALVQQLSEVGPNT